MHKSSMPSKPLINRADTKTARKGYFHAVEALECCLVKHSCRLTLDQLGPVRACAFERIGRLRAFQTYYSEKEHGAYAESRCLRRSGRQLRLCRCLKNLQTLETSRPSRWRLEGPRGRPPPAQFGRRRRAQCHYRLRVFWVLIHQQEV